MRAKPLLAQQQVTLDGQQPSLELVEVLQRLAQMVNAHEDRFAALGLIEGPTGGATVDAEARAVIDAIRGI